MTSGFGRVVTMVYGVFAISATGRSSYQIWAKFDQAPVAYSLSAIAAVIYLIAAYAMLTNRENLAFSAILIELIGVLGVGALSYLATDLFPDATVWSHFGSGYGYVPLVLPVIGLWWVSRNRRQHR